MEELVPLLQLQMEQGGQAPLTVTGFSMHPMLTPLRDRVWLRAFQGDVRRGDVILYRRDNGQYVLHRVIKLAEPLICCGDNQWQKEEVFSSQVIAVMTAFDRCCKCYSRKAWTYRLYNGFMVSFFFTRRPYIALRRMFGRLRRRLYRLKIR